MMTLTLLRPDWELDERGTGELLPAPRLRLPLVEPVVLGLVDNRKPNANRLMRLVGEELGTRIPISRVEVFSKPASSRPMEPEEATEMAARAHLVLTGVGD